MMIDSKLAKVIALWRKTEHDGERQSARAKIETLAAQVGLTVEQAISRDDAERNAANPSPLNIFAGFDDFMEAKEPGYKAKRAREIAEKKAARVTRKKALIEKYGSEEAALAPCERERQILIAVKPWRKASKRPHQRWTHSLDGWANSISETIPAHIDAAIRGAYALPGTFADARAEYDYWRMREVELQDLLDDQYGDYALDLVAETRMRIVERLIESVLVAKDAADVLVRFRLYREREYHDHDAETAIFNDLERIVTEAANVSSPAPVDTSTYPPCAMNEATPLGRASANVQRGQIEAAILADPSRSDRSIAREFRCSPTTVGKVRAAVGLNGVARSVHRRGQIFTAKYPSRPNAMGADHV